MLYQLSYASSSGSRTGRLATRKPSPELRNKQETHSRFPAYHGTGLKVSTRAEAEQTRKKHHLTGNKRAGFAASCRLHLLKN